MPARDRRPRFVGCIGRPGRALEPRLLLEREDEARRVVAEHAGRRGGTALRITETRWFLKEHRKEIPAGKNPADCAACHRGAEKGIYED